MLAAADRPRPTEPRERPNNAQRSSTPGEGSDESIALAMAMASRAHPLSGDGDEDCAGDGESMPPLTGAAAAAAALPHAIAHFCFPQGALLRDECRWPTTHQFALTDTQGQTLHGCCLTVWEPLASQLVLTIGSGAEDEEVITSQRSADEGVITSQRSGASLLSVGGEEAMAAAAEASACCAFAPGRAVHLSPDIGADDGADGAGGGADGGGASGGGVHGPRNGAPTNGRPINGAVHAATLYAPKCLCVLAEL